MPNIVRGNNTFPTDFDYAYISLHFDTAASTAPVGALIPSEYSFIQNILNQTNGSSFVLNMKQIYSTPSIAVTTSKTNISAYSGKAVEFSVTITGGTKASILLKLTKS